MMSVFKDTLKQGVQEHIEENTGLVGQMLRKRREKIEKEKSIVASLSAIKKKSTIIKKTSGHLTNVERSLVQISKNVQILAKAMNAYVTPQRETNDSLKAIKKSQQSKLLQAPTIKEDDKQDDNFFKQIKDVVDVLKKKFKKIPKPKPGGKVGGRLGSLGKAVTGAAKIGIVAELLKYHGALNANEDDELEKRRQQRPTITPPSRAGSNAAGDVTAELEAIKRGTKPPPSRAGSNAAGDVAEELKAIKRGTILPPSKAGSNAAGDSTEELKAIKRGTILPPPPTMERRNLSVPNAAGPAPAPPPVAPPGQTGRGNPEEIKRRNKEEEKKKKEAQDAERNYNNPPDPKVQRRREDPKDPGNAPALERDRPKRDADRLKAPTSFAPPPTTATPPPLPAATPESPPGLTSLVKLQPGVLITGITTALEQRLGLMAQAFQQQTNQKLLVTSGIRSNEQQKILFDAKVQQLGGNVSAAKKLVAEPMSPLGSGKGSPHLRGLAVDINSQGAGGINQLAGTRDKPTGWLEKFGLTRPVPNEDWHIQLSGTPPVPDMLLIANKDGSLIDLQAGKTSPAPTDPVTGKALMGASTDVAALKKVNKRPTQTVIVTQKSTRNVNVLAQRPTAERAQSVG